MSKMMSVGVRVRVARRPAAAVLAMRTLTDVRRAFFLKMQPMTKVLARVPSTIATTTIRQQTMTAASDGASFERDKSVAADGVLFEKDTGVADGVSFERGKYVAGDEVALRSG